MRIGDVIGKLTLSHCDPKMIGGRFLIVRAHSPQTLRTDAPADGEMVVVYDELGGQVGDRVSFSEGREGAMPFHPDRVAVDAYLAALLDDVCYEE